MTNFDTLTYIVDDRLARITLNRPLRLNAIDRAMPGEIVGVKLFTGRPAAGYRQISLFSAAATGYGTDRAR